MFESRVGMQTRGMCKRKGRAIEDAAGKKSEKRYRGEAGRDQDGEMRSDDQSGRKEKKVGRRKKSETSQSMIARVGVCVRL